MSDGATVVRGQPPRLPGGSASQTFTGWGQPFHRVHQRALASASGPTMCVSCKAPGSMCKVLRQEDLPELQKVVLAFVIVHVVWVSLLTERLEEHVLSSNET